MFNARIEMESMILNLLSDMPDLETRLQPLYAMIEREEQASDSGDRVGWNRLSNAFHVELARLIDNHVLFDIMNTLCARSSLIVAVFDAQRNEKRAINPHTHSEHREILDPVGQRQTQPRRQSHAQAFKRVRGAFGTQIRRRVIKHQ